MTRWIRWCTRGRFLFALVLLAAGSFSTPRVVTSSPAAQTGADTQPRPLCDENAPLCTEVADPIGYEGTYTGHDEPSLLFYSNVPGSGNNVRYKVRLPTDPPHLPTQDGTGGTFNFQLYPAFWFGMAVCDTQSAPEYTHADCPPDSDANIFDGSNPAAMDYIGKHPGTAFLELQFYPPGWVSWPSGNSCDATHWCAALNIDSFNSDQNSGTANNADCLRKVGIEPVNFAFITKSGIPHGPPSPLGQTLGSFTPNPATDLFMNSGDELTVAIHDTPAGLQVVIQDLTTGEQGSLTASVANGFAQVIFEPTATTCAETPYAFHPMYSTSSEHTRVPWAAHTYNIAFAAEIGHFEYCAAVDVEGGTCIAAGGNDPGGVDSDDFLCFSPTVSTRVPIGGCIGQDTPDFDGVSYQTTWPGTLSNPGQDHQFNPRSILFSSPTFNEGTQEYARVAFEADLPRIEAADVGGICNRTTGEHCVNPPPGAHFYPFFSTRNRAEGCVWQLGGAQIPGTQQTFGGNATAEFGALLRSVYPGPGFTPSFRYNNFRHVLSDNPCPG
jgi:hypothetical protein